MPARRAIVTGAGGFIGSHLTTALTALGWSVRGVDIKYPEFAETDAEEFVLADLRDGREARAALRGCQGADVYHLAADMGGIVYIQANSPSIMANNTAIDFGVIGGVFANGGCRRFLYTSSACVYPLRLQRNADVPPALNEADAWPAQPEAGYGLQKLVTEEYLKYLHESAGFPVRIARLHNIYGPRGTFDGGREKAPAAICRKVALCQLGQASSVTLLGDGSQVRSYTYIDDCVKALRLLAASSWETPLNIGANDPISVTRLFELVCNAAEMTSRPPVCYVPAGTTGVAARNCDATRASNVLGWRASTPLTEGTKKTYDWIKIELQAQALAAACLEQAK